MEFPYRLSAFATLISEGYFYQDRTDRIPQLEKAGRQLIFPGRLCVGNLRGAVV